MVAELQPAPNAKRSETEREATGSPVRRCSLMTAASTAWPRASGDQSDCVGFVEARIAIDLTGTASGAARRTRQARATRPPAPIFKLFTAPTAHCKELNPRPAQGKRPPAC